jgi:metal-responsive CopG/Arc/MetJ family transcriptional regulator
MATQVRGFSMPKEYHDAIDDYHIRLGYFYKSEFVQAAVREKFEREDVEVNLPET